MSDSEDLLPRRLDYVCRNADWMRRKLVANGDPDWVALLAEETGDLASVLEMIEVDLDLRRYPAWIGGGSRGPADPSELLGGFPSEAEAVRLRPHLECPRSTGERCTRAVPWDSKEDGSRPRCGLTGAELRWGGRMRWSDDDDLPR